jgi:hypothetical protein
MWPRTPMRSSFDSVGTGGVDDRMVAGLVFSTDLVPGRNSSLTARSAAIALG